MFPRNTKVLTGVCAAAIVATMTTTVASAADLADVFSIGANPTTAKTLTVTEQSDAVTEILNNKKAVAETLSATTDATSDVAETVTASDLEVVVNEVVTSVGVSLDDVILSVGVDTFSTVQMVEDTVTVADAQALDTAEAVEDTVAVADDSDIEDTVTVAGEDSDEEDYSNLVIAQVNDYVNVRSLPSEDGEILGKLYDDSVGTFVSEEDGWYEIISGSVQGYVKADYVVTGDDAVALVDEVCTRIATVTTTTLFVREEASTDASVIGMVPIEDDLIVLEEGETEGWVKVSIEEGEGYVSLEYVELSTEFVEAESKEEEEARLAKEEAARKAAQASASTSAAASSSSSSSSASVTVSGSSTGAAVANYGLQFLGNPYVYGGSSLTSGTDCSGFVMSVYAHFGVSLPHSSSAMRSVGYDVGGVANAQPGDIVCYSGHVAIYIGNGQIVHASTPSTGIKISDVNYRTVLCVRRIF